MALFFYLLIFFNFANEPFEATTSTQFEDQSISQNSVCTQKQISENKKILEECNSKWAEWGIEKPNPNELLNPQVCNSDYNMSSYTLGCASTILATPQKLGSAILQILLFAQNLDDTKTKKSRSYIFANGSIEEIKKYLVSDLIRKNCKLAPGDDSEYLSQNCGAQKNVDCNPYINDLKKANTCYRSTEFKLKYNQELPKINLEAQKIVREQERLVEKSKQMQRDIRAINSSCRSIIDKYQSWYNTISDPFGYLSSRFKKAIYPDKESIKKYNDCVLKHPKVSDDFKNALLEKSYGYWDQFLGNISAFKCYNPEIKAQIICDVVSSAPSKGVESTSFLTKKLGTVFSGR